jgi:hypothetical protein
MADEVGSDHIQISVARLPPFPEKNYELPDEQLGIGFWKYWCAYLLQALKVRVDGIPVDPIPPALLEEIAPAVMEAIRVKALQQDTANEALAGVEKALRLCASGDYAAGGRLLRQYHGRRIAFLAALDEAATRRHYQAAIAVHARPDYLTRVLTEIDEQNPGIGPLEATEELKRRVGAPGEEPRIHSVDEDEAHEVRWVEKGKPVQSALLSGVKDRLYKIRRHRSTG